MADFSEEDFPEESVSDHVAGMFGSYFKAVLKTAFSPTLRWADTLQLVGPAAIWYFGLPVPEDEGGKWAFLLLVSVASLVLLRLVFFAPYAVWRVANEQVIDLTAQLTSPEHRSKIAVEDMLTTDRIIVIQFITENDAFDILAMNVTSMYQIKEYRGPIKRLCNKDYILQPIVNELHGSYEEIVRLNNKIIHEDPEDDMHPVIVRLTDDFLQKSTQLLDYLMRGVRATAI